MKLTIERRWKKDSYTIGRFYVDGIYICNTMEDPDRGLVSTMSLSEIQKKKVYGETAIPKGTYKVVLSVSPKFKNRVWAKKYNGLVPEILNVPGYSGVRFHPLNTAADSLGCIGLGENKQVGRIINATAYHYKLMDEYLIPATKIGENVFLTII